MEKSEKKSYTNAQKFFVKQSNQDSPVKLEVRLEETTFKCKTLSKQEVFSLSSLCGLHML